jgi:hypothetical protein
LSGYRYVTSWGTAFQCDVKGKPDEPRDRRSCKQHGGDSHSTWQATLTTTAWELDGSRYLSERCFTAWELDGSRYLPERCFQRDAHSLSLSNLILVAVSPPPLITGGATWWRRPYANRLRASHVRRPLTSRNTRRGQLATCCHLTL